MIASNKEPQKNQNKIFSFWLKVLDERNQEKNRKKKDYQAAPAVPAPSGPFLTSSTV